LNPSLIPFLPLPSFLPSGTFVKMETNMPWGKNSFHIAMYYYKYIYFHPFLSYVIWYFIIIYIYIYIYIYTYALSSPSRTVLLPLSSFLLSFLSFIYTLFPSSIPSFLPSSYVFPSVLSSSLPFLTPAFLRPIQSYHEPPVARHPWEGHESRQGVHPSFIQYIYTLHITYCILHHMHMYIYYIYFELIIYNTRTHTHTYTTEITAGIIYIYIYIYIFTFI
jgi:hypothetical protein